LIPPKNRAEHLKMKRSKRLRSPLNGSVRRVTRRRDMTNLVDMHSSGLRVASVILMGLAGVGWGAPRADNVKGELFADTSSAVAGKPFSVGVLLHIAPQWHLYWINPGDSGLPTTVQFELPAGFSVSELEYPVPTKFWQPGDLIAYGYTDAVMLLAKVTPPKELAGVSSISIKANANWLVCSDVCVPGKGSWAMTLPVGTSAEPANEELFNKWRPQVPLSSKSADAPAEVQTQGSLAAGAKSALFTVKLHWKQDPSDVEFFPGRSRALNIHDIVVQTKGKVTTVSMVVDHLQGQEIEQAPLMCVAAFNDSQGIRRGIMLELPVQGGK